MKLPREADTNACSLCGQTPSETPELKPTEDAVRLDLDARIKEVEDSIERHSRSYEEQQPLYRDLRNEKNTVDNKLNQALKEYDSKFLAQSREMERQVAALEERIRGLKKTAEMPRAVTSLRKS